MEQPSTSTLRGVHADQPSVGSMRLYGRWLLFARMIWIAIFVSTLLYFCANLLLDSYGLVTTILLVAATSVWFAVSFGLFLRKSNDRVILLFSLALVLVGTIIVPPYPAPLYVGISWIWEICLDVLEFLAQAAILIFYLFPDGRFVPHWTRWLALIWIVVSLDGNLPSFLSAYNAWSSPFSFSIYRLIEIAFFGSIVFAQLYRYRRVSSPVQRQQTKWVVFAIAIVLVGASAALLELNVFSYYFPALALPGQLAQLVSALAIWLLPVLIPLSIGIALLRYRLWDIDLLINRTLVYVMLTVSIIALYILVVAGLGALLQAQGNFGVALLATGLVAVAFHPLRNRLQRAVNRLMYGERDDPYRVLTRLGQRLEATLAPEAVLPTIVEMVAVALKLPYVAITLKEEDTILPAVSFGVLKVGESLVRLPLVAHHERVGELVLAQRAPGETFTPADQQLLEDLSRQIGVAVYAVRLTSDLKRLTIDLQHSRERLVTAREEERRRLRRDLHDGLGPQLASLTLKLETARNRLAHDPLAQTLLSDLTTRTQATVADIRRLVYALRPPVLDELGLVSALRELTLQHSDQVAMHLDAPSGMPELPAAVEVAVYRIAQEALTNVVRHAAAHHCAICLTLDETIGWLSLSIQDDGSGLSPSRGVGVGLVSMRERAEELGGTWIIKPVESGGTRVLARLPLVLSEATDALVVIPTVVPEEEEELWSVFVY